MAGKIGSTSWLPDTNNDIKTGGGSGRTTPSRNIDAEPGVWVPEPRARSRGSNRPPDSGLFGSPVRGSNPTTPEPNRRSLNTSLNTSMQSPAKIPPIGSQQMYSQQREKSIVLDDDPPGQSGGTGGNKSGSRAGHQRLPVVHRDQGLAGRVRMAERSTKTLLSAALAAQQDIENQFKMNQEQWDGEKKNKKILQDHVVSIGNVVRQLGTELNAVEQRAQMAVYQGLQHMERQSMMAAGAVNMSKQQQDFMARAVDTAVKTMGADQRSFQKSVEAQLTQLRENLTGFNIEFSQLTGALNQTIVKTKEIDASQQANRAGIDQVAARLEGLDERFKALRDGQELQGKEMVAAHRTMIEDMMRQAEHQQREFQHRMDAEFSQRSREAERQQADMQRTMAANNASTAAELQSKFTTAASLNIATGSGGGGAGSMMTVIPVLDARLGQVSAELRELVAADRTFHVEGRKGIMETIDARLETLSNYVVETDKKLTQALSRMMDASGVHMRKIAKSQTENATSLVEKQNKDLLAKMAALEKKNIQLLRDLERRIHEETKLVADKIVATADNMDTVGSHITAKQNELEIQLSKVLKTVVIV